MSILFLFTMMFGSFITDCWVGYRHSLNCNSKNKIILIRQYTSLLVSDSLDNIFPNVTIDNIDKPLPLIVVSLPDDHWQYLSSESVNYCPSQAED